MTHQIIDTTPFLIRALQDLLEEAYNGLKWYRDRHPEDDSPADDELYGRIERALSYETPQPPPEQT